MLLAHGSLFYTKAMPGHYLHIDQGQGGVYTLPTTTRDADGQEHQVSAIGTSHCYTCVGVYIRLNDAGTRCFVAHISADLGDAYLTCTDDHSKVYLDAMQAKALVSRVKTKLDDVPQLRGWVKNTDAATKARNVFLISPKSEDPTGTPLTGRYIVGAIQMFVGLDQSVPDRAHGFCIEQDGTRTRANFTWNGVSDTSPGVKAWFKPSAPYPEPDSLKSHGWERGNAKAPELTRWDLAGPWSMNFHLGEWYEGEYRCQGQ